MTIAMLMANTVKACRQKYEASSDICLGTMPTDRTPAICARLAFDVSGLNRIPLTYDLQRSLVRLAARAPTK